MCKYNNRLFSFIIILQIIIINNVQSASISSLVLDGIDSSDIANRDDYDVIYDQRQTGTENLRIHVDGVIIGLPGGGGSGNSNSPASFLGGAALGLLDGLSEPETDEADDFFLFKNVNATKEGEQQKGKPIAGSIKDVSDVNSSEDVDFEEESYPKEKQAGSKKRLVFRHLIILKMLTLIILCQNFQI